MNLFDKVKKLFKDKTESKKSGGAKLWLAHCSNPGCTVKGRVVVNRKDVSPVRVWGKDSIQPKGRITCANCCRALKPAKARPVRDRQGKRFLKLLNRLTRSYSGQPPQAALDQLFRAYGQKVRMKGAR